MPLHQVDFFPWRRIVAGWCVGANNIATEELRKNYSCPSGEILPQVALLETEALFVLTTKNNTIQTRLRCSISTTKVRIGTTGVLLV
jgi:hypothetical protein